MQCILLQIVRKNSQSYRVPFKVQAMTATRFTNQKQSQFETTESAAVAYMQCIDDGSILFLNMH